MSVTNNYTYLLLKNLLVIVTIFIISSPCIVLANGDKDIIRLHGKVIQKQDSSVIYNVHVINLTRITGTSSAHDGSFAINIMAGDTLMFQAIGYVNDSIFISENFLQKTEPITVTLKKRTYRLPRVNIYPYTTYSQFKQAFIYFDDDKLKDSLPDINLDIPQSLQIPPTSEGAGIVIPGAISMIYDQFSKSGRELRKYLEVKEQYEKEQRVARLVNPHIVRNLTDMDNEQEIYQFIDYCNLSYEFVINAKEYQVYQAIVNCYRRYKLER